MAAVVALRWHLVAVLALSNYSVTGQGLEDIHGEKNNLL